MGKNIIIPLILMILTIVIMVGLDRIIFAVDIIDKNYNIDLKIAGILFLIAEFLFNLGIFIILKGSGIFKGFKHIRSFKLKDIKFDGREVYVGFIINRTAAIVPWVYVLLAGWGLLPPAVVLAILTEICIVIAIGFFLPIKKRIRSYE